MSHIYAYIKDGSFTFGSLASQERAKKWLKKHEGRKVRIQDELPISGQMRRFFEGAVVPYFAYQHFIPSEVGGYRRMSFKEAREALKLQFNPQYVTTIEGDRKVTGGSTKMSKAKMEEMLELILHWSTENGYEFPDSEDYKKWRDSGPLVGEVYPPLKRIIELSDNKLEQMST
jgi:hypothetical protein